MLWRIGWEGEKVYVLAGDEDSGWSWKTPLIK